MLEDVRLAEKETETVRLQIDGKSVEAPKGLNIVEAAKRVGIDIPVFCYHPQLSVIAACRMCLVEIEGRPKLTTACSTEVAEGISVRTASPAAREGQRSTLEFLLINHPLDCPVCDKGGECPLQDLTYDFGPGKSRFSEPKFHFKKPLDIGPRILLDRERCIMCMRCTRFCEEIAWHPHLVLAGTTTGIQIATAGGLPFNSQFSGNTVEICPVGALLSKQYYLQARPWEIDPENSICADCSVGCNVTVHTREGRIKRIITRGYLPRKTPGRIDRITDSHVKLDGPRIESSPLEMYTRGNPEIDDGWLCDRGRFGFEYVHENRMETPLEKIGETFVPISWEKAIETIARRLKEEALRGGNRIGAIGAPTLSNEASYLFQKFFRTEIGTNHIDHHPRSEWGAVESRFAETWNERFVRFALRDLDEADTILLIGSNVSDEQPVAELRIKKALRLFHTRLVMAYPWEAELSPHADPWLRYTPGEALSLVQALQAQLDGNRPDLEARAKQAGIGTEALARMAAAYQASRRLVILLGPEVTRSAGLSAFLDHLKRLVSLRRGEDQWTSIGMLQEACNSQGAADLGLSPEFLPGYQPVHDPAARNRLERLWGASLPAESGLSARKMMEAVLGAADGGIRALYIMGANLVIDKELGGICAEAIPKIPFVVAQDLSLTETARLAQIVLPMASWAEADGTYTNTDRHVQRFRKTIPFAGESRPDWQTLKELGRHFGSVLDDGGLEAIWDEIGEAAPLIRTTRTGMPIEPEGQWGR